MMTTNKEIAYNLIKNHFDELSLEDIAEACDLDLTEVKSMLNKYQKELIEQKMLVNTLFGFIKNENFDAAQETLDMMKIQKIKRDENIDFLEAEKIFKRI
ncbi:TPA: hypothetical protein QFT23_000981 [Bacillus cereus]|nr:hypothetical protein [Bacillus cereus]